MKILHTSDWHLGHTLYQYDRTEEQADMLRQMTDIVAKEQPDVFVLSGDVYHTPQPSAAVQTLFTDALVKIHEANPDMTIIVTAGNHDSSTRHEIFRTPWQALHVFAIGQMDREHPENHLIEVPGKGWIIALPYCNERNIPDGFFQQIIDLTLQRNTAELPVIMMAHTTVKGCDFQGHDHASEYTVGGIDSLNIEELGQGFDYLALGHIHHEQWVKGGQHRIRYCGTPIPVSFDECYEHSVSLVSVKRHGDPVELKKIPVSNLHPLVTLPAFGRASWEEAKALLADFPSDIPAYIRLNVETPDFLPVEAQAEAIALTEGKLCRFCVINAQRTNIGQQASKAMTVQEFQAKEPIDIARQYAQDCGITFDDELSTLFKEASQLIHEEK